MVRAGCARVARRARRDVDMARRTEYFYASATSLCSVRVPVTDARKLLVFEFTYSPSCCDVDIYARDASGHAVASLRPPTCAQKFACDPCGSKIVLRVCNESGVERFTLRAPPVCGCSDECKNFHCRGCCTGGGARMLPRALARVS